MEMTVEEVAKETEFLENMKRELEKLYYEKHGKHIDDAIKEFLGWNNG